MPIPCRGFRPNSILRGFDLLTAAQGDLTSGLIVMTLVREQMGASRHKAVGFRELSRKLDMPAETVRRHILSLVQSGQCVVKDGGVAVPPAVLRGRRVATYLRKIYVNAIREQTRITIAATGLLLAGIRAMRGYWGGDVMKGLVFTAISATNVKHATNGTSAAIRAVLPDSERQPVSVLGISRSLRMPYETIATCRSTVAGGHLRARRAPWTARSRQLHSWDSRRHSVGPSARHGIPGRAAPRRREGLAGVALDLVFYARCGLSRLNDKRCRPARRKKLARLRANPFRRTASSSPSPS